MYLGWLSRQFFKKFLKNNPEKNVSSLQPLPYEIISSNKKKRRGTGFKY